MSKDTLSIIIPTINEENGIIKTLEDINRMKKQVKDTIKIEVIVVDGLSSDNTIKNAVDNDAIIILETRKGKGIAMKTGVDNARGDIICFIDGDGTYSVKHIPIMFDILNREKCDMVVGSRLLLGEGAYDTFKNYIDYKVAPWILSRYLKKFNTTEPSTGMRMMNKKTWYKMDLKADDFFIELDIEVQMSKNHFSVIEIPVPCVPRIGKAKFTAEWKRVFEYIKFVDKNEKHLKNTLVKRIYVR